ncbi:MAG: A/G-specific adenine glycosylase, partial [Pseudomonadota bacterium]
MDEKLHFADLPAHLLDWYRQSARQLPWRIGPGDRARGIKPDPYRVW